MAKRFCAALLIFSALLLGNRPAHAVMLEFVPVVQDVVSGTTSPVDIYIAGLGAASVSAFSFDIGFDPAIVAVTNVIPAPYLGDPTTGEALFFQSIVTGLVSVAELSLLSPTDLDALQSDRFRLATLFFAAAPNAVPGDISLLEFTGSGPLVLDAFGQELGPISVQTATLRAVPEPSGLVLVGLIMLIAFGCERRIRTRSPVALGSSRFEHGLAPSSDVVQRRDCSAPYGTSSQSRIAPAPAWRSMIR